MSIKIFTALTNPRTKRGEYGIYPNFREAHVQQWTVAADDDDFNNMTFCKSYYYITEILFLVYFRYENDDTLPTMQSCKMCCPRKFLLQK